MNPYLNIAIKAARKAGQVLDRHFHQLDRLIVEEKGVNDLVSNADTEAELVIIETIQTTYPDHSILAEESGTSGSSDFVWIIDPLDGTTNFVHGHPHFCISIALRVKNKLEVGVIYDPLRNELFSAVRGKGAQLNQRRIRVSDSKRLATSLIATGFIPTQKKNLDQWTTAVAQIMRKSHGIRRDGSAALDLAWTAAARFDGFFEGCLSLWDVAAGILIVREAGGVVCDYGGDSEFHDGGSIIAANTRIQRELLAITHKAGHTNQ